MYLEISKQPQMQQETQMLGLNTFSVAWLEVQLPRLSYELISKYIETWAFSCFLLCVLLLPTRPILPRPKKSSYYTGEISRFRSPFASLLEFDIPTYMLWLIRIYVIRIKIETSSEFQDLTCTQEQESKRKQLKILKAAQNFDVANIILLRFKLFRDFIGEKIW